MPIVLQCPICGKSFVRRNANQRHCSLVCGHLSRRTKSNCATCGVELQGKRSRQTYCSRLCAGRPRAATPESFWARVDKNGPVHPRLGTSCWLWQGYRKRRGGPYGVVRWSGALEATHRLAWRLTHGEIANGLQVLHHCDNPPCVNPAHLFLGTNDDNVADKMAKGRRRGPPAWYRHPPESVARGEAHCCAKLTEEAVRAIRVEREAGATIVSLGAKYGVAHSLISMICLRKIWRHVA